MALSTQLLEEELKKALKEKQELRTSTLRMLLSALHNAEKDKKYKTQKEEGLTSEEIESVVASEAKKRRESIEAFKKADRQELVAKEKEELDILLPFLPEQLSEEEVEKLVREAIVSLREMSRRDTSTESLGPKDMGRVMALLAPKVKGRADGSLVSAKVKSLLA